MSKDKTSVNVNGCGCFGCLGFIAVVIAFWALIFGVTVGGHHYGVSCTTDRGVVIE